MSRNLRKERAWLLTVARTVAVRLKQYSDGTKIRIRKPTRVTESNTDGWYAIIGDMGKNQPRLEIWLDRFSGYPERKLYACFRSAEKEPLMNLTKHVSRNLWPVRVITMKDTNGEENDCILTDRLKRAEFNVPILEKYEEECVYYFGFYDPTRKSEDKINSYFCDRAVAFFEDVARAQPKATEQDEQREVYPQLENRQQVASHIRRERSRYLSTERKILDDYQCQVCGMRFEEVYGEALGARYAEAHHLVPLGKLEGAVKTKIEDLRTVCANCHRMLHRMDGKRDDIAKLKATLDKHRKK